ncbi:MAG: hypothetical protein E7288_02760 [Lachnospiraceae bacterium]|nr:hypothetical protein [Lachnospiraceae bacterium]
MKFNEFAETIREELEELMKQETKVSIHSITKNNGVVLHGITIYAESRNISPTIYLEEFYHEFLKGKKISEIVREIHGIYVNDTYKENIDISFFTEFEKAKETIIYKLVNYEKNKTLLEEVPHVRYLDFAIVFLCMVQSRELGNATILIRNSHLTLWQKSEEEIYKIALENTPRLLPPDLRTMEEILGELYSFSQEEDEVLLTEQIGQTGMYVLSNEKRLCGAAAILYPDVLRNFAEEQGTDIIILPSSVHEVILITAKNGYDRENLKQMVTEVNETQVDAQEVLSDGVYLYLLKEDKVISL